MYLSVFNIGLKMTLYKPKHVAKKLIYWCYGKRNKTFIVYSITQLDGSNWNIYIYSEEFVDSVKTVLKVFLHPINLLEQELFFLILAHPVHKM